VRADNTWTPLTGWPADYRCTDRNASRKLNCSREKPCLFHLRDDPHERRDLAAVNASMLHRVLRRLEALQRTVWHNCDPPSTCATIEPADYCANAHARHENTYGPMP